MDASSETLKESVSKDNHLFNLCLRYQALCLINNLRFSRSVMSDSEWPHRRQPTRLPCPWDSPGKKTGVGCHFLLQGMKVKSESEVTQSCPTQRPHGLQPTRLLCPWDFPGKSTEGLPLPSPIKNLGQILFLLCFSLNAFATFPYQFMESKSWREHDRSYNPYSQEMQTLLHYSSENVCFTQ